LQPVEPGDSWGGRRSGFDAPPDGQTAKQGGTDGGVATNGPGVAGQHGQLVTGGLPVLLELLAIELALGQQQLLPRLQRG